MASIQMLLAAAVAEYGWGRPSNVSEIISASVTNNGNIPGSFVGFTSLTPRGSLTPQTIQIINKDAVSLLQENQSGNGIIRFETLFQEVLTKATQLEIYAEDLELTISYEEEGFLIVDEDSLLLQQEVGSAPALFTAPSGLVAIINGAWSVTPNANGCIEWNSAPVSRHFSVGQKRWVRFVVPQTIEGVRNNG